MNTTKDTLKKVLGTISRFGMIDPGDLIIIAVSGGPDSVCLLDILHELMGELKISLVVAQYNHGLRPEEDESETQFVRQVAASMHLPFETEKAAFLKGGSRASMEEKARNARYGFLESLQHKLGAQKIAVGHNLNDQAETVIMRMLRGSGPKGLAGIPPIRNNRIIRPLIEIRREEIESYLRARKLTYVIDRSNFQTKYLRNKIRLELIPTLLKYQPRLMERLGQMALILGGEDRYLEIQTEDWVTKNAKLGSTGEVLIPISSFLNLGSSIRNRIARQLLRRVKKNLRRIEQKHVQSIDELARGKKPQAMINLPDGVVVKKIYDRLVFTSGAAQKPSQFYHLLHEPGTFYLEEIDRSISIFEINGAPDLDMNTHPWTAHVDADKIRYPLIVRNFRAGDRFIPLGMTGHKKVKDFFMDLKIPSEFRARIPILISQGDPVWICGHRIDDRFKVTPETKRILKVTVT